jgi:hypothetical protein
MTAQDSFWRVILSHLSSHTKIFVPVKVTNERTARGICVLSLIDPVLEPSDIN